MAKIRIDLNEPFLDGMDIKFKAPCNCTAVDGMIVYYELPDESGVGSQTFTFRDTHGNNLAGLGNLFTEGALVKVIVDRTTSYAYIQNAATNGYLEDKIANAGSKVTLSSSVSSTSTTTAANSYAVKQAYDKANAAIPASQKNVANGVAGLDQYGFLGSYQMYENMSAISTTTSFGTFKTGGFNGGGSYVIVRETPIATIFVVGVKLYLGSGSASGITIDCRGLPNHGFCNYKRMKVGGTIYREGEGAGVQYFEVDLYSHSTGFNMTIRKENKESFTEGSSHIFNMATEFMVLHAAHI